MGPWEKGHRCEVSLESPNSRMECALFEEWLGKSWKEKAEDSKFGFDPVGDGGPLSALCKDTT